MKRRIVVEHGEVKAISKIMRCTHVMVSYALSFRKDSLLARKIRKVAIERGGVDTAGVLNHKNEAV